MTPNNPQLTENQRRWLNTFLAQVGEEGIGKKFQLVHHGNRKSARLGTIDIAVNLTDDELIALSRLGYLEVYTSPPQIVFTSAVLNLLEKENKKTDPIPRKYDTPELRVLQVDIIQVYAWLLACLAAGLFALILLWLTVQQILAENITTGIASAVFTLVSSLLSAVFFKNYDKANDRLKHLRSQGDKSRTKDNNL